jgi:uncharacterized repeat protein (TIGR03803 family)
MAYFVVVFCAPIAIGSPTQTFKSLVSFDGTNGGQPYYETLAQGTDGNFYGTTIFGGGGSGNVFRITPAGVVTSIYDFPGYQPYGSEPQTGLVLGKNGSFYGTAGGGAYGYGIVFKITLAGALTTLYSFCAQMNSSGYCTDGNLPAAPLIQATDGNFYGTTFFGGANNGGTVFKITPKGTLTTLYGFCTRPNCGDGQAPYAGLVQGTDGNFYGTTVAGGANGEGTVFKITSSGKMTTIHNFCAQTACADGERPYAGLIQATDGEFYGTTSQGGANAEGTAFRITSSGTLTTLHRFCSQTDCDDGEQPVGGLVQATDGNFYGTTSLAGGLVAYGTVFKLTPAGILTTLHVFDNTDGNQPLGGLVQGTNGIFYGTTNTGGTESYGTVFSVSRCLEPFVKTVPTSGKVGTNIIILGNNLTDATSVTFNGVAAPFTVVRGSEIKTAVPTGAATGLVEVTTPKRTLKSDVTFRVK